MVDTFSRQLLEASFRGVTFRVRNEVISEAGRRIILHEYPNSSERFAEDIGQIPPRFQIDAFVHGENFQTQANALRAALDETGTAQLIMPTFGVVTAQALSYSVDASQTEVGEVRFRLEFAVTRPIAGPTQTEPSIEDIFEQGDEARGVVQRVLDAIWSVPSTVYNSLAAQHDLKQLTAVVDVITTGLVVTQKAARYSEKLGLLSRDRARLVRNRADLAENLIQGTVDDAGIWQQLSLAIDDRDPEATFDAAQRLMSFGSDLSQQVNDIVGDNEGEITGSNTLPLTLNTGIPLWAATTAQRVERNENRVNFVQANRVAALVFAFERAAGAEYQTEIQVQNIRERLQQAFDAVMRDQFGDRDAIQSDPDIRRAVDNIRFSTFRILEQKRQISPGVTDITLPAPLSSTTAAYGLYAETFQSPEQATDTALELRRLNPASPAMDLEGEITIFERDS